MRLEPDSARADGRPCNARNPNAFEAASLSGPILFAMARPARSSDRNHQPSGDALIPAVKVARRPSSHHVQRDADPQPMPNIEEATDNRRTAARRANLIGSTPGSAAVGVSSFPSRPKQSPPASSVDRSDPPRRYRQRTETVSHRQRNDDRSRPRPDTHLREEPYIGGTRNREPPMHIRAQPPATALQGLPLSRLCSWSAAMIMAAPRETQRLEERGVTREIAEPNAPRRARQRAIIRAARSSIREHLLDVVLRRADSAANECRLRHDTRDDRPSRGPRPEMRRHSGHVEIPALPSSGVIGPKRASTCMASGSQTNMESARTCRPTRPRVQRNAGERPLPDMSALIAPLSSVPDGPEVHRAEHRERTEDSGASASPMRSRRRPSSRIRLGIPLVPNP